MYLPKTERWELKVKAGKEFVLFIDRLKLTDPEMAVRLQRQAENAGESFVGLEACRLELIGITNGAGPRYKYRVLRCPLLTTCNAA